MSQKREIKFRPIKALFCKHKKHSIHSVCPVIKDGRVENYERIKQCTQCGKKESLGPVEEELQIRYPDVYNYRTPLNP